MVLGEVGAAFVRQKTVALITYRRDRAPVGTPVSIAVDGQRAYVRSFERAWKTRRIANHPTVMIAPSTIRGVPTGPAVTATARPLTEAEYDRAARLLARKYPLLHGLLVPLAHRIGRSRTGRTVHFELTPGGQAAPASDAPSSDSAQAGPGCEGRGRTSPTRRRRAEAEAVGVVPARPATPSGGR